MARLSKLFTIYGVVARDAIVLNCEHSSFYEALDCRSGMHSTIPPTIGVDSATRTNNINNWATLLYCNVAKESSLVCFDMCSSHVPPSYRWRGGNIDSFKNHAGWLWTKRQTLGEIQVRGFIWNTLRSGDYTSILKLVRMAKCRLWTSDSQLMYRDCW